jgi:hypothetical protein
VTKSNPDLSPLLPDDATVKARRAALVDAVGRGGQGPQPEAPWRRRGPRLALGSAMVLAAIAVALIVSAGGDNTPAAFAVESQDGGGVTIKVFSLEDPTGLEGALAEAGIDSQVSWLPTQTICREPHYSSSEVKTALGGSIGGISGGGRRDFPLTIGIMTRGQYREQRQKYMQGEISADEFHSSTGNFALDPDEFRPGQSVVLSGSPTPYDGDPGGGYIFKFGIAQGSVEPCEPVPALPSGSGGPFGFSPGGGPAYAPRGDETLSQAAIAAALQRTADAARSSDTQLDAPSGPSQFLYTKTKVVHLEAWDPDGPASGPKAHPRYFTDRQLGSDGNAMPALVPTLKQVWTAPDGTTREREALGRVDFLSGTDQRLWEEAGSPPPFAYDPTEHDVGRDSSGRPLKAYSSKAFRGRREFSYLARLSRLPTAPEALRLVVENRRGGSTPVDPSPADSPRGGATVERLLEILSEPIASPALRAAAFDALAEIPGIGLERDVADVAGRPGVAISWVRERGFGRRYIFDPRTSEILAEAEMIFNAKAAGYPGVPDDTVFRETAYLQSGIVDSRRERP